MKDLGKTIAGHRKDYRLTQSQLAEKLTEYGIYLKPNSVSAWKSELLLPSSRQLLAICEILNIYDIYTEFIVTNPGNPFHNLNKEGLDKVMEYTCLLEKSSDYRIAEIIPLHVIKERKVYYTAVSVGNGSFLDGEDYEMYSSADIPDKTDFGVHVSRNHMKPCFHDEDLIWTEQAEQLENGEIGIFYFDRSVYVKKLQNNRRVVVMGEETVVCRLKERRTSLGFTQRQVAEGTEMNVRTVINIEKGKTIPNLLYAMKLAKFLGLRVEEVFEYNDL